MQPEGFRSKRHMKLLLDDMRKRRVLRTEPNVANKSFGFRIGNLPRKFQAGAQKASHFASPYPIPFHSIFWTRPGPSRGDSLSLLYLLKDHKSQTEYKSGTEKDYAYLFFLNNSENIKKMSKIIPLWHAI